MANLLDEKLGGGTTQELPRKQKKKKEKKEEKIKTVKPVSRNNIIKQQKEESQDFEEELELEAQIELDEEEKNQKKKKRKFYFAKISLSFCCLYLIFLIYGTFVTNYDYDKNGHVTAQIMTVEDVKNYKSYSQLLKYYLQAREFYQKVLLIDYRLGEGKEDTKVLGTEYAGLLDNSFNELITQTKALKLPQTYTPEKDLLYNWLYSTVSGYVQNIRDALTKNNSQKAQEAVIGKEEVYNEFYQLTANMISLGEKVKGVNITTLKEWSPEKYLKEQTGK